VHDSMSRFFGQSLSHSEAVLTMRETPLSAGRISGDVTSGWSSKQAPEVGIPAMVPDPILPGKKLVNVLIKMHGQLGQGMPQLGISVTEGKSGETGLKKSCVIKQVVPGSPAHSATSLRPGDVIHRVNTVDIRDLDIEEVVAYLRKVVIDCKWTYSPIRLQVLRETTHNSIPAESSQQCGEDLMTLMSIAIRKNTKMVASKRPNPMRQTLLQRGFCDQLDQALARHGYYDVTYHI